MNVKLVNLLVQCFPLFVALFMYNLIDNMPKFDGRALTYDNQLYFNALYFPRTPFCLPAALSTSPCC